MNTDQAAAIALDVWKDPQGYVLIEHVRDEAWFYFKCWQSAGVDASYIGCLHFEGVWHISSSRFHKFKSYPNIKETDLTSYYLIITNSALLNTLKNQRAEDDPNWEKYDKRSYNHWVVESHDYYTNIIAAKVSFSKIEKKAANHFLAIWDKV